MSSNFKHLIINYLRHQAKELAGEDTLKYAEKIAEDVLGESTVSKFIDKLDDERDLLAEILADADTLFVERIGDREHLERYALNWPLGETQQIREKLNENRDEYDPNNLPFAVSQAVSAKWRTISVEEAKWITETYCNCVSDAMARAGRLQHAQLLILKRVAIQQRELPDSVAKRVVEEILQLTPKDPQRAYEELNEQFSREAAAINVSRPAFDISLNWNDYEEPIGRAHDASRLHDLLNPDSQTRKRYVVLHGLAGVGKTTLAQYVLKRIAPTNQLEREQGHYDLVVWFSVSEFFREDRSRDALDGLLNRISERLGVSIHRREFDDASDKEAKIIEALGRWQVLIVVDVFKREIEAGILKFITQLPTNVTTLVIRRSAIDSHISSTIMWSDFLLEGVSRDTTKLIMRKSEPNLQLTEEQLNLIHERTGGNPRAISICAKLIQVGEFESALQAVVEEDDYALRWVGGSVQSLKKWHSLALLQALSLFAEPAHKRALVSIAGIGLPEEQVDQALNELITRDLARQVGDQRFLSDRSARDYARPKDSKQLDDLRDRWADFYYRLRDREIDPEIGWTIMTDYEPDGPGQLKFRDELEAIAGAIDYCLGESRDHRLWRKAAKMVDDFRQPFFAGRLWSKRVEHCEKILKLAQESGDIDVVAQFQRLLAWVHCFRECPPLATQLATLSRQNAENYLQEQDLDRDVRVSLLQSLYKANNTLAQINLIQARSLATEGHRFIRSQMRQIADDNFSKARPLFIKARHHFVEAQQVVAEHFPQEQAAIKFHLAEVAYYDRNPATEEERQNAKGFTYQQLKAAQRQFKELLFIAREEFSRPHQRLSAHCQYYLGKIARRLESDAEAWERLGEAEVAARQYSDEVLLARVQFAQTQWHEAMYNKQSLLLNPEFHQNEARRLHELAVNSFKRLNLRIEFVDAVSFGNTRLMI